jgi:hypothetical protein
MITNGELESASGFGIFYGHISHTGTEEITIMLEFVL